MIHHPVDRDYQTPWLTLYITLAFQVSVLYLSTKQSLLKPKTQRNQQSNKMGGVNIEISFSISELNLRRNFKNKSKEQVVSQN